MSISEKTKETLFDAVRESIENMAFMEVSRGDGSIPETLSWVSMTIEDPIKDRLYLGFPEPLLRQLTSSVFAVDEEDVQPQMMQDILAELLNTLGGVFFTRALPSDQTYQLGLPVHGEGAFPVADKDCCWDMVLEGSSIVLAADGTGLNQL